MPNLNLSVWPFKFKHFRITRMKRTADNCCSTEVSLRVISNFRCQTVKRVTLIVMFKKVPYGTLQMRIGIYELHFLWYSVRSDILYFSNNNSV